MAGKSYLHLGPAFPIGIRRNNPGNLAQTRHAYPGVTTRPDTGRGPQFLAFVDMAHGLLAANILLVTYIEAGYNTITKISARYLEKGTKKAAINLWVGQVARYSGLATNQVLTTDAATLRALCLGIIKKEVGLKFTRGGVTATITGQDYDDAIALLATN